MLRQMILSSNWGFQCRCSRCLAEEEAEHATPTATSPNDDGVFQAVLEDDAEAARRIMGQSGIAHPDELRPARDSRHIINFKAGAKTRPLWMAARLGHVAVAKALLLAGAGSHVGVAERSLHAAAREGHSDMVELLLAHGADAGAEVDGATAADVARARGHSAVAELLRTATS